MPYRLTTPPTAEPLHLDEVKAQLRIQYTSEDTLLAGFLTAARQHWEETGGRALVAQTLLVALDQFPCSYPSYAAWTEGEGAILLPRSPALAIDGITYVDSEGATQTVPSADYLLDTILEPNRVMVAYGKSWPSARYQPNSVQVTYRAGYTTPFTATDQVNDIVTLAGRAPVANEMLRLWNSGGGLPGGLSANTDYYVVNVSGQTCKLSLTEGGAAVNITSAGTGLHYAGEIPRPILHELMLWVGNLNNNREGGAVQALKCMVSQQYRLYGAQS